MILTNALTYFGGASDQTTCQLCEAFKIAKKPHDKGPFVVVASYYTAKSIYQ